MWHGGHNGLRAGGGAARRVADRDRDAVWREHDRDVYRDRFGLGNDVVVNYHWEFGSTLGTADTTTNQVTRTYAAGTGPVTPRTVTTSNGKQAIADRR